MAFWKKDEDPWDIDPSRVRAQREREARRSAELEDQEESGSLLDGLRAWKEQRETAAREREAAWAAEPAEKCPWCGKDMERGYLNTGKGGLIWTPGRMTTRAAWIGPPRELRERQLRVDNEGVLTTYKTAWYCPDCEKMTIDAAGLTSPWDCEPLSLGGEEEEMEEVSPDPVAGESPEAYSEEEELP